MNRKKLILPILLSLISHNAIAGKDLWIAPTHVNGQTSVGVTTALVGAFKNPPYSEWVELSQNATGFQFHGQTLEAINTTELSEVVQILKNHGLKMGVEVAGGNSEPVPAIQSSYRTAQAATEMAYIETIVNTGGGTLELTLTVDSAMSFNITTFPKLRNEAANMKTYIDQVNTVINDSDHPNTKVRIGMTDPVPLRYLRHNFSGIYFNEASAVADGSGCITYQVCHGLRLLKEVYAQFFKEFNSISSTAQIDFIRFDTPYNYLVNNKNRWSDLHQLTLFVQSFTKKDGTDMEAELILNTASPMWSTNANEIASNNQRFSEDTVDMFEDSIFGGGVADAYVVESWYHSPTAIFPVGTNYTHGNVIKKIREKCTQLGPAGCTEF